ncbi:TetR/AcrR family transcriptional regulator [Cohnella nanjingensis]|uniref:TetR/AcrR family transcriptional regulator n=2 Tax=Cohnella nanjingensis TaxID=1387779 RepID=A0A7X0RRR0_9BACL|nr:TetR/AcrR family transcriptional regulator [Cohnella nanjingensis]
MSIEQIVDAAIAIADQEGIAAVSMNRVAASLGFTTMSLYRYIPSKDDLLLLMQDAVCDMPFAPVTEGRHWRDGLREYVRISVGAMVKHAWYGDLPISGVPITPNNLQVVDYALGTMRELPLNDYEKMSLVLLASSYARSVGIIQRDIERAIRAGASPGAFSGMDYTEALRHLVTEERYPNLHPLVMSGAYTEENTEENTVGNDFDFGLERILDGIEFYLNAKK